MRKPWMLVATLAVTALMGYLCWPNALFHQAQGFNGLLVLPGAALVFGFPLVERGWRSFWTTGLAGTALVLPPMTYVVQNDVSAAFGWWLVLVIACSIFLLSGGVGALASFIQTKLPWAFPLTIAAVFAAQEVLRLWLSPYVWFLPAPWHMLGYSLAQLPPLIQMASLTGVTGVTFLVAFVAGSLTLWAREGLVQFNLVPPEPQAPRLSEAQRRASLVLIGVVSGLLLVLEVAGNFEAWRIMRGQAEAAAFKPGLVQSEYDLSGQNWIEPSVKQYALAVQRKLVLQAVHQGADLVMLTENTFPGMLPYQKQVWEGFRQIAIESKRPLFLGALTQLGKESVSQWYQLTSSGEIAGVYFKRYLVPFGEYFPARSLLAPVISTLHGFTMKYREIFQLTLNELTPNELSAGRDALPFEVDGRRLGLSVCDEILFPQLLRASVLAGAQAILSPAAGNWFKHTNFGLNYVWITQFRAVESRRWIARSMNMHNALVVDPAGYVRAQTPYHQQAVLVSPIGLVDEVSTYTRLGSLIEGLILALVLGLLSAALFLRPTRPS